MKNEIIQGNCLEIMGGFDDNSIDSIITDPPYGLKFMDKKWDYEIPSIEIFQEMLRVAKPGAFLLCFGGSRTFHRMAVNIEDAGWEIRDTIMWLYGSGFPKSYNISKGIDKHVERGDENIENQIMKTDGNPFETKTNIENNITKPATPEAQLWDGYGTALKPAFEPIIVAIKPIDKNFVNNALVHGVAGLNIDGSRVGMNGGTERKNNPIHEGRKNMADFTRGNFGIKNISKGRFPANLILDQEAGELLDEQSGELKSGKINGTYNGFNNGNIYGKAGKVKMVAKGDKGGASRFFQKAGFEPYQNKLAELRFRYCAKASRSERNAGCEELEEKKNLHTTLGIQSEKGQIANGRNPENRTTKMSNNHPTVKPLALMEYLCNLTRTPTGGIVLDPYAGSGTTLCACVNTNREYIGIEMDEEYIDIIKKRVEYYKADRAGRLF